MFCNKESNKHCIVWAVNILVNNCKFFNPFAMSLNQKTTTTATTITSNFPAKLLENTTGYVLSSIGISKKNCRRELMLDSTNNIDQKE